MTDEQIMAIRDRHGRASRGEWQPTGDFGTHLEGRTPDGARAVIQVFADRQADAVFLASAHEDVAALLGEVEEARPLLLALAMEQFGRGGWGGDECPFCSFAATEIGRDQTIEHADDCPVTKARHLLVTSPSEA